jgi:hypothetical protein
MISNAKSLGGIEVREHAEQLHAGSAL